MARQQESGSAVELRVFEHVLAPAVKVYVGEVMAVTDRLVADLARCGVRVQLHRDGRLESPLYAALLLALEPLLLEVGGDAARNA